MVEALAFVAFRSSRVALDALPTLSLAAVRAVYQRREK
jgi:hypothetical protein